MMPLTMVNTGEPSVIKKVGGKEETRRFLEKLGFVPGGTVTVVSEIEGNLIVNVKIPELPLAKIWPTRLWSDEKCYLRKNQKTERVGKDENIKRSCLWTDCHSEKN